MDKIILIGGSPTAGKTFTAKKLSTSLNFPWISTDTIRAQMRKLVRKEDYPALFIHAETNAEMAVDFLTSKSAEEIVKREITEGLDVWKGVEALVTTDYAWGSFIIEGVAILPQQAARLSVEDKEIITLFLIDDNIERTRETIFTRGLWDKTEDYPDSVKEKEIAWVMAFNKFITSEAKKYGQPVIKIGDRTEYIQQILELVK